MGAPELHRDLHCWSVERNVGHDDAKADPAREMMLALFNSAIGPV